MDEFLDVINEKDISDRYAHLKGKKLVDCEIDTEGLLKIMDNLLGLPPFEERIKKIPSFGDQLEKFNNHNQTEEDARAILKDAEKI